MMRVATGYQHARPRQPKSRALENLERNCARRGNGNGSCSGIGDAVIATDLKGKVFLESTPKRSRAQIVEGAGQPGENHIIDGKRIAGEPAFKVLRGPSSVWPITWLISKAGVETAIEDSAAP